MKLSVGTHFYALLATGLALAGAATGCSSSHGKPNADKAGGSTAPVVLRLATTTSVDQHDAREVRYFAAQVAKLSGGDVRVRVVFEAAGRDATFPERQIARRVRAGGFDLGWMPARAWDELGVDSLRAFQTPFLITSYSLLDRVLATPMARRMARGVRAAGVVDIALVPDLLQHPLAADRPVLTRSDYAGLRMRVHRSRLTDALVRALGARPVHAADTATLAASGYGRVDGLSTEFPEAASTPFVATANVTFFPKVAIVFASREALDRLTTDQRAVVHEAAKRTRELVQKRLSEPILLREFCRTGGRAVTATRAALAELEQAAEPVTAELERDPETKAWIEKIRAMKAVTPPGRPVAVPRSCAPARAAATGRLARRPPSILNGTYRYTLTQAAADAFGPPMTGQNDFPVTVTVVLRDGEWSLRTDELNTGTYTITGNRVAFRWPRVGYTNTFTFSRDRSRTIHLKPVLPMDRGDQFVWANEPWRRVGPPIKLVAP